MSTIVPTALKEGNRLFAVELRTKADFLLPCPYGEVYGKLSEMYRAGG
jgi:hypothetical protein